jgi:fermentation-respiration switch protein FrsA (DUF1100 family)
VQIGALVLHSPFRNIKLLARQLIGGIASVMYECSMSIECCSKLTCVMRDRMNRFQNDEEIQHVTAPTLIIHGRVDALIPYQHAEHLHRECASPRKELLIVDECVLCCMRAFGGSFPNQSGPQSMGLSKRGGQARARVPA